LLDSGVVEGAGELKERDGLVGAGVDGLGVENDRDGAGLGVEGLGAENDLLPPEYPPEDFGAEKERPFAAANAGAIITPSTKMMVTARVSTRRTQAQGRMVPLPWHRDYQPRVPLWCREFLPAFG
jgi:hypothetical protein